MDDLTLQTRISDSLHFTIGQPQMVVGWYLSQALRDRLERGYTVVKVDLVTDDEDHDLTIYEVTHKL